jgi:hypothetical protein
MADRNAERTDRLRMKVRLIKRFADAIDGISLARCRVGDVIDFPSDEARVLLASEWAVLAEPQTSKAVDAVSEPNGTATRPSANHRVVHGQTANAPEPDCHG